MKPKPSLFLRILTLVLVLCLLQQAAFTVVKAGDLSSIGALLDLSKSLLGGEDAEEDSEVNIPAPDKANFAKEKPVNGIRPSFKEAMDAYEAVFDSYIKMVEKIDKNSVAFLTSYADFMVKVDILDKKMDAWEDEDLSNKELAYWMDVHLRVSKKLLEVSGD